MLGSRGTVELDKREFDKHCELDKHKHCELDNHCELDKRKFDKHSAIRWP